MTALRTTNLLLLVLLIPSCTEPNPDYDGDDRSCTAGARLCSGANLMVCLPRPEPHLELERVCPGLSRCVQGACVPSGVTCQGTSCGTGLVCAVFAVPGTTRLGTYCAQPTGARPDGQKCSRNDECQSGLCVRGVCFRSCGKNRECGSLPLRCIDITVTVNGISSALPACVP